MNIKKRNRIKKTLVERCARMRRYARPTRFEPGETIAERATSDLQIARRMYASRGVPELRREIGRLFAAAGRTSLPLGNWSDKTIKKLIGDAYADFES